MLPGVERDGPAPVPCWGFLVLDKIKSRSSCKACLSRENTGNNGGSGVLTYLQVKTKCRVCELLQFVLAPDCRTRRIRFSMADKDIILEKFSGHTATDWTDWLEDYICYADMKKWNETKQVQNLRFFVSGDIRDCVRATTTNELKVVSDAGQALLAGEPTSLIASQAIDNIKYSGNILVMVQEMWRWGNMSHPRQKWTSLSFSSYRGNSPCRMRKK